MSRFELHIAGIDQALSELYQVRKTLAGSISSVSAGGRMLAGQKTVIAGSACRALARQTTALNDQFTATEKSLNTLKQIKNDVRLAELRACHGESTRIDFVKAASVFFDPGWIKSTGKAFSALAETKGFSLLHGEKNSRGGLVNLSGNVGEIEVKGGT